MILLKPGVKMHGVQPALVFAITVAHEAFLEHGVKELVVTALRDGTHRAGSLHYVGFAADLRSHAIPTYALKQSIIDRMKVALGPEFDVLLEDVGGSNEHIHVEFQPKTG